MEINFAEARNRGRGQRRTKPPIYFLLALWYVSLLICCHEFHSNKVSIRLITLYLAKWSSSHPKAQSSHQRKTPGAEYYPFRSLYFGDQEGLNGLIDHLGEEDPFTQRIIELVSPFSAPNTRKPFQMRHGVDVQFRDLVSRMTNLAPAARITARQALEHDWFRSERGVVASKVELEEASAAFGIDSFS